MTLDLDNALATAKKAVDAASEIALRYWEKGVEVETKADQSPVTIADKESEAAILRILLEAYPSYSVLGEETGARAGDPKHRWIVDPIDGTRGFTRGGKFWGSLVGLEVDGEIVVGAMAIPALGERYWAARGRGCYKNGTRVYVPKVEHWSHAVVSLGEMQHLFSPPYAGAVTDLVRSAAGSRCYGDLMGLGMVLSGLADIWLEVGVKAWDVAPTRILTEEAGGRFSNFIGGTSIDHGSAICANPALTAHALARISAR